MGHFEYLVDTRPKGKRESYSSFPAFRCVPGEVGQADAIRSVGAVPDAVLME